MPRRRRGNRPSSNAPAHMRTCYSCGAPATNREHVPPKCFFPRKCRANLITVGSCSDHNQGFSEDDRHARTIMVMAGGSPEGATFWNQHVSKSYQRVKNRGRRLARLLQVAKFITIGDIERTAILPGREFMYRWIGKVARGLCFYHCAVPTAACSVICDWQAKSPLSLPKTPSGRLSLAEPPLLVYLGTWLRERRTWGRVQQTVEYGRRRYSWEGVRLPRFSPKCVTYNAREMPLGRYRRERVRIRPFSREGSCETSNPALSASLTSLPLLPVILRPSLEECDGGGRKLWHPRRIVLRVRSTHPQDRDGRSARQAFG